MCLGMAALVGPALAATTAEDSSSPAAGDAAPPPGPVIRGRIRAVTFNIAWLSGRPGRGFVPRSSRDLDRVARVLRGTHFHLACLQEVLDEEALAGLCERMNALARGATDYRYAAEDGSPLLSPPGERAMSQRLGMIYDARALEVLEGRVLEELGGEAGLLRPPLWARVRVRGSDLDFDAVGVHLKSGFRASWAREIRAREVLRLATWLRQERKGQDPDVLLLGDFNSPRDDETLLPLDEAADAGDLVAVEEHLVGDLVGTHIPWEVGIDRMFATRSLWDQAGTEQGAAVYRFDDFMPESHEVTDFCIRSKSRIRDPERRCACGEAPEEDPEADEGDWIGRCEAGTIRWARAANYVRVSDHRPLLWDLAPPRIRPSKKPWRKRSGRTRRRKRRR